MAARANWKGVLRVGELACEVALYTAASTSERIVFHTLNRKTGHRIRRQFIDAETHEVVEPDDQVKGYEMARGEYVVLEPEEIAQAIPDGDKTLAVEAFLRCGDIDDVYFDRPYYLAPSSKAARESYALLRDGMRAQKVAALARAVLFRRMRSLLIRPQGDGLVATTLDFDYEVTPAQEAFAEAPEIDIEPEMLDLARHIIRTKAGAFDVKRFDDRYEAALTELVKAKIEGRPIEKPKPPPATKPASLLEALRASAAAAAPTRSKSRPKAKPAPRRKAS